MRNSSTTRLNNTIAASLLLTATAGCSVDDDVSVGRTGDTLNLDQCYGGRSACDQGFDVLGADMPEPVTCSTGARLLAIETPLPDAGLDDGAISPDLRQAALAPDGSYWLVWVVEPDDGDASSHQIFIEHLEADGTLVGLDEIAQARDWNAGCALSADDLGGAAVAVYTQYAPDADAEIDETTLLYSYLPDATLRMPPLELSGVADPFLAVGDSGDYAIAGNAYGLAKRGVMGRMGRDGTLAISTNDIPTRGSTGRGLVAFAADEESGYTLLAETPDSSDSAPRFHVLRYEPSFQAEWSVALPSPAAPGYGANMATDALSRVVAAAVIGDDQEQSLGIYGYDSDGTPRFVVEPGLYVGNPIPQLFANRESSTVWVDIGKQVVIADGTMRLTGDPRVMEVDLAGASCEIHEYSLGGDAAEETELPSQASEATVPTPVFVVTEDRIVRLAEVSP